MDIDKVIAELRAAHEHFGTFKEHQKRIIKEEAACLAGFSKLLLPFATRKSVGGQEALLIYVFASDEKTFISPEVYLRPDGSVTYQVYNEAAYRGYRPDARIENGFVVMPIEDFLQYVTFSKIYEFFKERVEVLYEAAAESNESNKQREEFIKKFKSAL